MSRSSQPTAKPMLPFFKIISPRNPDPKLSKSSETNESSYPVLTPDSAVSSGADLPAYYSKEDVRKEDRGPLTVYRQNALDILPIFHTRDPAEMLQMYQKNPTSRRMSRRKHHNEVGVHKMHRKAKNFEFSSHKHTFGANFPGNDNGDEYTNIDEINQGREACTTVIDGRKVYPQIENRQVPHVNLVNKTCATDDIKVAQGNSKNIEDDYLEAQVKSPVEMYSENKEIPAKPSRKILRKENEKLASDNNDLNERLKHIDKLMVQKEEQLQLMYSKMLQMQKEGGVIHFEECHNCDEFKRINEGCLIELEQYRKENNLLKSTVYKTCQNSIELENNCAMSKSEAEKYRNANKNLNEDLNMLKNVVFRLNVQLERYQDKLREKFKQNIDNVVDPNYLNMANVLDDLSPTHGQHAHMAASWGNVNTHTLAPLLDAYQDALIEKDALIKNFQTELEICSGKLKDILIENELLHKKVVDDEEKYLQTGASSEETQKEMLLLKDKNEVLTKKCASLSDKMQELLKVYEQKVENMSRDYEQLHTEYHKTRSELCTLQGKHQILLESIHNQKRENENFIPISVHNTAIGDSKRAYEELKNEYEHDKNRFQQENKSLQQRCIEIEKEVIDLRTEKRELQTNARSLDKMLRKVQLRHDQQQSQLVGLQTSRDACRRQLQRAFTFSRELVHEQEHLLAQLAAERQRDLQGTQVSHKMDSLRTQLKTLQADAIQSLDSVEHKIHEQDSQMSTLKRNFDGEIEKLNEMLSKKDEMIKKLQTEANRTVHNPPPYLLYRDKHVN